MNSCDAGIAALVIWGIVFAIGIIWFFAYLCHESGVIDERIRRDSEEFKKHMSKTLEDPKKENPPIIGKYLDAEETKKLLKEMLTEYYPESKT